MTVGITTMNRPDFCAKLIGQIGGDDDVKALLDEVLVMEQGTDKVADSEFFAEAEASLEGKLRVIEQGNIGGSGGFARAQFETLKAGRSKYVLFLDDDIVAEPESILRAVTFGDLARRPSIVGGHMFSLFSKSRLHSYGEIINRYRFWWMSPPTVETDWDFAARNLRSSRWLHRRVDVDFNPWFMCLIPTEIVREIGLSLPLFIKWDDSEYGVRAQAAGFPTDHHARRRRLARPVDRQERRARLAGLLPPAQPVRRGAAALAVPARRPDDPGELQPPGQAPAGDAVLHRRAAPPRPRGRAGRSRPAARRPADQARPGPRAAQAVHRRPAQGRPRRLPARRGAPSRASSDLDSEIPGRGLAVPLGGQGLAAPVPRHPARSRGSSPSRPCRPWTRAGSGSPPSTRRS